MSLPALSLLQNTGLPLVLCARPWAKGLLESVASQHDFIALRGRLREDVPLLRTHVQQRGPGARALTLPPSLSSTIVFRLAGLPVAGYRGDGRALLLRWPITPATEPIHRVMSWYGLTRTVLAKWHLPDGPPTPAPQLSLTVTAAQRLEAQAHLEKNGLAQKNFILIAPTATGLHRGQSKVWPGYAELTRILQAQGLTVVMCPPPSEIKIAQHHAPTADLLPAMSLGAFAALTLSAALVICNDSGVSHLAAAVGARQLTLFGVTQQSDTGPWSPHAHCLGSIDAWPTITTVTETVLKLVAPPSPPHSHLALPVH